VNNLDTAIKGLEHALADVVSQQRALAKEQKRIERALDVVRPANGRPVGQITGVSINKGRINYPNGKEMAARRTVLSDYLATLQPGATFTVDDFVKATGQPSDLLTRKMWMAHLRRTFYKGEIQEQTKGNTHGPTVYVRL
jgi:hypothetical protein